MPHVNFRWRLPRRSTAAAKILQFCEDLNKNLPSNGLWDEWRVFGTRSFSAGSAEIIGLFDMHHRRHRAYGK